MLDPEALTIGFARRFATYKRGTLLLRDPDRLKKILNDTARPIQFLFAGKSHPADSEGKELIKQIIHFARDAGVRRKVVFLENYDMNVARYLVQGVDVWLNTPRRPYEASGTSGMKAAANGVLNCSILDGWWVEGYAPDLGWAIGRGETYTDTGYQDHVEGQALYDILEKQIIPLFYQRSVENTPHEWIARMKNCMRKLAPVFNTNRMVRDYAEKFYLPSFARGKLLAANGMKRAIALAKSKDSLRHRWSAIKIVGVHTSGNGHFKVGESMQVEALVDLPGVDPDGIGRAALRRPGQRPRRNRAAAGPDDDAQQGDGPRTAPVHRQIRLPHQRPAGICHPNPARRGRSGDAVRAGFDRLELIAFAEIEADAKRPPASAVNLKKVCRMRAVALFLPPPSLASVALFAYHCRQRREGSHVSITLWSSFASLSSHDGWPVAPRVHAGNAGGIRFAASVLRAIAPCRAGREGRQTHYHHRRRVLWIGLRTN